MPASWNNFGGAGIRGGAPTWLFTGCLWGMTREGAEKPELIDVGTLHLSTVPGPW